MFSTQTSPDSPKDPYNNTSPLVCDTLKRDHNNDNCGGNNKRGRFM
jgi:hypothetical protein